MNTNESLYFIEFDTSATNQTDNQSDSQSLSQSRNKKYCQKVWAIPFFIGNILLCIYLAKTNNDDTFFYHYNNIMVKLQKDEAVIKQLTYGHLKSFYYSIFKNLQPIFITAGITLLLNLFLLKLALTNVSRLISTFKVILHVSLIGIGALFLFKSGKITDSEQVSSFLGLSSFKYQTYNFNYAIAFFSLQLIWILFHYFGFPSDKSRSMEALHLCCQFSSKIGYKYYGNGLMSLMIGVFLIVGFYISGIIVYNCNPQYSEYFKQWINNNYDMSIVSWYNYNYNFWLRYRFYYELIPILYIDLSQQLFKIDHILFIVASLWIISVFLELTSNVYKCLYYQHTVSFYSQKRCFFRIIQLSGSIIYHQLFFPLKIIDRLIIISTNFAVDEYYGEAESEKCCKIGLSKYATQLLNSNAILQGYISKEESFELNERNCMQFCLKHQKLWTLMKNSKLLVYFLQVSFSCLIGLIFAFFFTFMHAVRNLYFRFQYLLLFAMLVTGCMCRVTFFYISCSIDSLFYSYANHRSNTLKYPIKITQTRQLFQQLQSLLKQQNMAPQINREEQ